MLKKVNHIALFLAAVFLITVMPFNLLHHHEEDEHAALMDQHGHHSQHHCELDDHFCQPGLTDHCEHTSHIQKTLTKCFSCHFHFVSPLDMAKNGFHQFMAEFVVTYTSPEEQVYSGATVLLLNKGPPAFPHAV